MKCKEDGFDGLPFDAIKNIIQYNLEINLKKQLKIKYFHYINRLKKLNIFKF